MKSLFIVILLLIGYSSVGQIVISTNPTGRHAEAIQKGKAISRQLKLQRQAARKKKKELKELKEKTDSVGFDPTLPSSPREDSLKQVLQGLAIQGKFEEIERIHEELVCEGDSLSQNSRLTKLAHSYLPPEHSSDSLSWALHTLSAENQYEDLRSARERFSQTDSIEAYEQLAQNLIPQEELVPTTEAPELPKGEFPDIPTEAFPHTNLDNLSASIPAAGLDATLKKVSKLKKKYTTLPDIRYPKSGTKKSSLKDQGLASRFSLGGNLSLASTDPVAIDVNLQAGYRFNRNFTLGSGIQWEKTFSKDTIRNEARKSYSLFTRYIIYSGIYAYGEWATTNRGNLRESGSWSNEYYLGVGRETHLYGNFYLTTTLLYNFAPIENESPSFSFRIGVNVNGLGKLKKNVKR